MSARLILGPSQIVLREQIAPASIDMIYSDPPFGNDQVWTGTAGTFDDRWEFDDAAAIGWAALREHSPVGADLMTAIATTKTARGYLGMMADLLLACRAVLKPTGTLWLHFDDTMGAHLRVLGDVVFGYPNQFGTVIWKRATNHASAKSFGRVHDTIACFGRSPVAKWRLARCKSEFVHGDPTLGRVLVEGFADDQLNARSNERVGYPTQKPVSLIERFVRAGSLPGDTVLDPTCGSGTTLVAAQRLGRRAIGIDMSEDALTAARARLRIAAPIQADLFSLAA